MIFISTREEMIKGTQAARLQILGDPPTDPYVEEWN